MFSVRCVQNRGAAFVPDSGEHSRVALQFLLRDFAASLPCGAACLLLRYVGFRR